MRLHPSAPPARFSGGRRLAAAGAGLALATSIALTAAAYTDAATANLGTGTPGSGVGNPHRFDIAIHDADGVIQDAPAEGSAVVLPLASGTMLSEHDPVELTATVVNRDTSIDGDLLLRLYDPVTSTAWKHLRFTVYLDNNATPAISDATADAVNTANLGFAGVIPGAAHTVKLSITLATGTSAGLAGSSAQVGLRFDGESR